MHHQNVDPLNKCNLQQGYFAETVYCMYVYFAFCKWVLGPFILGAIELTISSVFTQDKHPSCNTNSLSCVLKIHFEDYKVHFNMFRC